MKDFPCEFIILLNRSPGVQMYVNMSSFVKCAVTYLQEPVFPPRQASATSGERTANGRKWTARKYEV